MYVKNWIISARQQTRRGAETFSVGSPDKSLCGLPDTYECTGGDCIPQDYRCNGWGWDCLNRADETDCGTFKLTPTIIIT